MAAGCAGGNPHVGSGPTTTRPWVGTSPHLLATPGSIVSRDVGSSDRAYWVHGEDRRVLSSEGGGIVARFTASGVFASTRGGGVLLSGVGLGRATRFEPLHMGRPVSSHNRVTYTANGVLEWFSNGPLGLEQGFTITHPPSGSAGRPLTLALRVGGPLRPSARGAAAAFVNRSGHPVLAYRGLRATDATGRRLTAWLEARGRELLLHVSDTGARYPLRIDPYIQQGSKLVPSQETGNAQFGQSVAISADGSTAIVGGPHDNSDQGAAWIFVRSGGSWVEQAKLTAPGSVTFGWSVALSADGNTVLIGGYSDNRMVNGHVDFGSAWVFTRSGTTWSQQGPKLAPSDAVSNDSGFGYSVALSDDGNTALIGGSHDNNGQGAAWVFTRSGGAWTQQGPRITPTNFAGATFFGESVALSADGNTALVGAPNGAGGAWVFDRSGSAWSQDGSSGLEPAQSGGSFGYSVALSGDGTAALIAAPTTHAAWVFLRSGSWVQGGTKLTAKGSGGALGGSVALSGDGSTALIGGTQNGTGAAWDFHRSSGGFVQEGSAVTPSDAAGNSFGSSVSLSGDGHAALIGGAYDASGRGAAWLFKYVAPPAPHFTLTVTKTGTGAGTVTSSPAGINCGPKCSAPFAPGTKVALTPIPAPGSEFAGWSGICPEVGGAKQSQESHMQPTAGGRSSACTGVTMNSDQTIVADFITTAQVRGIRGDLHRALASITKSFDQPSSVASVECKGQVSYQVKTPAAGKETAQAITATSLVGSKASMSAPAVKRGIVVFAGAQHRFLRPGTAKITQRLTRQGRRILEAAGRRHRTLKLRVVLSFTVADPAFIEGSGIILTKPPAPASNPCSAH